MKIELTKVGKDILYPLLKKRLEEERKIDEDIKNHPFHIAFIKSLKNLIDNVSLNEPIKLTKNNYLTITSCINPELTILQKNIIIKKTPKEAIEWVNIQKSDMVILEKFEILESILVEVDKKYQPRQYFKIFDLISNLKSCKNVILSKCNDSYFYKVRFVKKNYDIFQIELSNILNLEYREFSKSSKSFNSIDLRNRNVNLFSKKEALKEIQNIGFVSEVHNKNTFDFIVEILSGE